MDSVWLKHVQKWMDSIWLTEVKIWSKTINNFFFQREKINDSKLRPVSWCQLFLENDYAVKPYVWNEYIFSPEDYLKAWYLSRYGRSHILALKLTSFLLLESLFHQSFKSFKNNWYKKVIFHRNCNPFL